MNQLLRIWNSLTLVQRISLVVVPVLVGAVSWGLVKWHHENDFRTLYTALAPEDAAAVTQKIREAGIEFRMDETGATVLVPSGKIAEARLALAGAGLPRTGRIGFELFDRTNLGASDFAEQVNYRRALEGELERTAATLSEVAQARIHITFAKESVFLESRQPAKATVVLKLKQSAQISKANVMAIANLIASAVDGLGPEAVAIIDTNGRLLNRPRPAGDTDGGIAEANLEYRRQVEAEYLAKINAALEPVLGAGRYRAGVNVECDFSTTEENNETYDAATSTLLTSQSTEETTTGTGSGGTPGTASNLPQPPPRATLGSAGTMRKTENYSFQPGRTVRRSVSPKGGLRRVSTAVLLDQTVHWDGSGAKAKRTLVPPSPEVMKSVHDVIAGITGFSEQRGDLITVETIAFEGTLATEPPPAPAPQGKPKLVLDYKQPAVLGGAAVALLLILAVVFLLLRRPKKSKKKGAVDTSPEALKASEEAAAAAVAAAAAPVENPQEKYEQKMIDNNAEQAQLEAEALSRIKLPANTKKTEILVRFIRENVSKDPVAAANVLRTWVSDDGRKS